jgi:hypothetical protein
VYRQDNGVNAGCCAPSQAPANNPNCCAPAKTTETKAGCCGPAKSSKPAQAETVSNFEDLDFNVYAGKCLVLSAEIVQAEGPRIGSYKIYAVKS